MKEHLHFKDQGLDRLAESGHNIAQFVSYGPDNMQRFSRTLGTIANYPFGSVTEAAHYMLANSAEHSVNVRSFAPDDPKSKPFDYGLTSADDVATIAAARHADGLHTIINETISIDDGGVSGVSLGNVMEFAPFDTPRCVEKPGTARLTRALGADILERVYGFAPELLVNPNLRTEFSIHPLRHGYRDTHTITWEAEQVDAVPFDTVVTWPNRFSEMLGDKTYGLLIADTIGLPVPRTTVFNRTVKPFTFGKGTGSKESWLRTAPNKQTPGKFTTIQGWTDPYKLLEREDPTGEYIASVLCQDGVNALYSGACIMAADDKLLVEGKAGKGDSFMVGEEPTEQLPIFIERLVEGTYHQAASQLGPVRMEWVYDGTRVWVVQLHVGKSASTAEVIYPGGEATEYITYDTANGLEGLRELIEAHTPGTGIILKGSVGVTSHFGDVLRKAAIPSKLSRQ